MSGRILLFLSDSLGGKAEIVKVYCFSLNPIPKIKGMRLFFKRKESQHVNLSWERVA